MRWFWLLVAFLVGFVLCIFLPLIAAAADYTCQFTWEAPTTKADGSVLTDLAGYHLYFAVAQGGPFTRAGSVSKASTRLTVPCVVPSWWQVTAFNETLSESLPSNTFHLQTPPQPPAAPSVLRLEVILNQLP